MSSHFASHPLPAGGLLTQVKEPCLTAEAPNRAERARLLETVARRGFIDDYSGVRIAKSGRRFRINRATVWNLLTETGQPCGQAAMFDHWEFL
mgnify:CR=1 FL=1